MTPEQLLEEFEKLLDECDEAIEGDSEVNFQGRGLSASEVKPVLEYTTELVREFVVAQTKPKSKKRS
jgi:hypothetical protein